MVAPKPPAARRRTNSSSSSVAVPFSWEESVVSGAIANRFAVSRPQLNLSGDQTTIDPTSTHKSLQAKPQTAPKAVGRVESRAKVLSPQERSEIARAAASARWKKARLNGKLRKLREA